MKLDFICCNFGSHKDGIGHYSKKIYDTFLQNYNQIDLAIYTEYTYDFNKMHLFFSFKMTKTILKYIIKNFNKKRDYLIIEYPFNEWNPFLLITFLLLRFFCSIKGITFILSLHEYSRLHFFRRIFIRVLLLVSNIILVTDINEFCEIKINTKKIFERDIPSNIIPSDISSCYNKKNNLFSYFGLITNSKAFNEMLEGWLSFNKENKYELYICTSSKLELLNPNLNGVKIFYDLDDNEVSNILSKSQFSIIPVKPYVSNRNGTLKAALMHGSIPICKIDNNQDTDYRDIFIDMDDYEPNEFIKAYSKAISLSFEEKNELKSKAIKVGEKIFCRSYL